MADDGAPLRIGSLLAHSVLVSVPCVGFPAALGLDLLTLGGVAGLASAAKWCLGIGLSFAFVAGVVGALDYMASEQIGQQRLTGAHMGLAMTLLALEGVNVAIRYSDGPGSNVGAEVALSCVSVTLMVVLIVLGRSVVKSSMSMARTASNDKEGRARSLRS